MYTRALSHAHALSLSRSACLARLLVLLSRYAELHQKVIRDDRIPATIEVFVLSEISPILYQQACDQRDAMVLAMAEQQQARKQKQKQKQPQQHYPQHRIPSEGGSINSRPSDALGGYSRVVSDARA